MTYLVYWSATRVSLANEEYLETCSLEFGDDKLGEALNFQQELRQHPGNRFIAMASENPNMVGKFGVSDPSPDYNWTKRRYNERPKDAI